MDITATPTTFQHIHLWRDMYRLEMACQVVHDSIHIRRGWTQEYLLTIGNTAVGYGSVAIGGPWANQPALYEFFVIPTERQRLFELFQALLTASGVMAIEVQSNDALATVMLHAFAPQVTSEAILFHDKMTTALVVPGATVREPTASEAPDTDVEERQWRRVVEIDGRVAASGGVLFHYNRPYGDIYMDVEEPFRRRGVGSFLVQELKRACYEGGHVPAARCNTGNVASQRTLQRAGFVPCGHILKGLVAAGL
jgi:GNAT superfamily N-acetyltransferase